MRNGIGEGIEMKLDSCNMRFGEDAHPVLMALQTRVDQIPKESLNFVAALMAARDLIPVPMSDLIFGMIAVRNGIEIGPVHHALASAVALWGGDTQPAVSKRNEKLALIAACGMCRAADGALKFVIELPSLMEHSL
jgi:hypothetical protein